jgi:hypothetical protein
MTVTRRIRSPGRARYKPLKPLRAGMPGDLGATCGDYARVLCFTFAREAAGALGTRHSPRPLFSGRKIHAHLGRIAPRDCGVASGIGCLKFEPGIEFTSSRPSEARAGTHSHRCRCYVWLEPPCLSPLTSVVMGPGVRRDDSEIAHSTRWLAMTVSSGCLKFESASTPLRVCGGGYLEQFLAARALSGAVTRIQSGTGTSKVLSVTETRQYKPTR